MPRKSVVGFVLALAFLFMVGSLPVIAETGVAVFSGSTCRSVSKDLTDPEVRDFLASRELIPLGKPQTTITPKGVKISRQFFEVRGPRGQKLLAAHTCEATCSDTADCSVNGCDATSGGCSSCSCSGFWCTGTCTCKKLSSIQTTPGGD